MSYRWPKERTERLRELVMNGILPKEIAVILGVSINAVYNKIDRCGLRNNKPSITKVDVSHEPVKFIVTPENKVVTGEPVTFDELGPRHCRWPLWTEQSEDKKYCGKERKIGSSYCEEHHRVSWRK